MAAGADRLRNAHPGALPRGPALAATTSRGRLRSELRATWLGGARMLERLEQRPFRPRGRASRRWALTRRAGGRRWSDAADEPRYHFYYSFLVLPAGATPRHHRGVGFCRAVDDAVDEARQRGRRRCRARRRVLARARLAACLRRRLARIAAGAGAAAVHRPVRPAAAGLRGSHRRRRDGPRRTRATRPSTTCVEYCRRVASTVGHHLHRHLRLPPSRRRATTP